MNILSSLLAFRVETLDQTGLERASAALLAQAQKDFQPNLLLGIRSGGYVVAECMMKAASKDIALLPITCRRPSSGAKQESGALKSLLLKLPYLLSNQLRIAEHIILTQIKKPKPKTGFVPDAFEMTAIKSRLDEMGGHARILIVDDAVDTGATFKAVTDIVRSVAHGDAVIKTASITVTTENPLLQPDYFLFHYVLCRFPWSLDFKQ